MKLIKIKRDASFILKTMIREEDPLVPVLGNPKLIEIYLNQIAKMEGSIVTYTEENQWGYMVVFPHFKELFVPRKLVEEATIEDIAFGSLVAYYDMYGRVCTGIKLHGNVVVSGSTKCTSITTDNIIRVYDPVSEITDYYYQYEGDN